MARIRSIKPEFWVDDKIVDLSLLGKLLYIGLWNFADDEGYIFDSHRQIKRQVFPDNDYDVQGALEELTSAGLLAKLDSDQGGVLFIIHFSQHQKPQHPTPTKFTNVHAVSSSAHDDSREIMNAHSVVEGRGVESRGIVGEVGTAKIADSTTPKKFCPKHPDGTAEPCWACKSAREEYEKWVTDKPLDCAHGHHTVSPDTGQCVKCMKWIGAA